MTDNEFVLPIVKSTGLATAHLAGIDLGRPGGRGYSNKEHGIELFAHRI